MRELPHAAEGKERAEAQLGIRMCVNEGVAYKYPVLIVLEHHLFLQQHAADAVYGSGHFIAVELTYVFMSLWTVVIALVLMESEVELSAMLYDRHVKRGKEHMIVIVELRHWNDEQAMILASVAVHDGGA